MNYFRPQSLEEIWERLEEFRIGIEGLGKRWDLWYAMRVMNIDPSWFIDDRTLELLKIYLFCLPFPAQAFPGGPLNQPSIYVTAKMCIDAAFEPELKDEEISNG